MNEHLLSLKDARERRTKLEEYLDRGMGACHLRDADVAATMEKALLHFHNQRYELKAWCMMPNHVHVLVQVWQTPLGKLVQSWKRFVAVNAEAVLTERRSPTRRDSNAESPETPAFRWQREYWDTFMRDGEQERKAVTYIEANPVKARLCAAAVDWEFGSARRRNEYGRLNLKVKLADG